MEYDPTPIPESITYDGSNLMDVAEWAYRTIDHYELPNDSITIHNRAGQDPSLNGVTLTTGSAVTFDDRTKQFTPAQEPWMDANGPVSRSRQFDQGPEILATDHPMTVAESAMIQNAQRKLGTVSIPEPGREFIHRRAAGHLDATTVTNPEVLESMRRHPSNSLSRRAPAERYSLVTGPGQLNQAQGHRPQPPFPKIT